MASWLQEDEDSESDSDTGQEQVVIDVKNLFRTAPNKTESETLAAALDLITEARKRIGPGVQSTSGVVHSDCDRIRIDGKGPVIAKALGNGLLGAEIFDEAQYAFGAYSLQLLRFPKVSFQAKYLDKVLSHMRKCGNPISYDPVYCRFSHCSKTIWVM